MVTTTGRCNILTRAVPWRGAALAAALVVFGAGCTDSEEALDGDQPAELAAANGEDRGEGPDEPEPVPDDLLPAPDLPEPAQAVGQARAALGGLGEANGQDNRGAGNNNGNGVGQGNDAVASDDELLTQFEPLDGVPSPGERIGLRDGRSRNEAGELRQLDESASLACGDVEVAVTAFDEGDVDMAKQRMSRAAERAAASAVAGMAPWADSLSDGADSADPAVLVAFLSACTEGGYEL